MKILWGKIEKMDGLTAPLCLMWTIWKQKNKWAFINVEHSDQTIKFMCLYTFGIYDRVCIEDHKYIG